MKKIDLNEIQISANGRNVRFRGKALDKLGISQLIRDVANSTSYPRHTLATDVYWYAYTKIELVSYLRDWMLKIA